MLGGIDNLPEIEIWEKRISPELDPGGIHDSSVERNIPHYLVPL